MKDMHIQAAINAAKIGLFMTPDASSTAQATLIANTAIRLAWYETRIGFGWENQHHDWESICQRLADYIARKGKVPKFVTIAVLMMTK